MPVIEAVGLVLIVLVLLGTLFKELLEQFQGGDWWIAALVLAVIIIAGLLPAMFGVALTALLALLAAIMIVKGNNLGWVLLVVLLLVVIFIGPVDSNIESLISGAGERQPTPVIVPFTTGCCWCPGYGCTPCENPGYCQPPCKWK